MKPFGMQLVVILTLLFLFNSLGCSESLKGKTGFSSQWGSGWIDLGSITSFKRGERIKLIIGGTAKNIIVRLLPKGEKTDDPVGIEAGIVKVPDNRIVQITLTQDHPNIRQISVHGGPNPWGMYPLGDNGPATIVSVERISK
jgi:hypothetical protein